MLIRARLRRYSKAIFGAFVGGFKGLRELAVTRELCGSLFSCLLVRLMA